MSKPTWTNYAGNQEVFAESLQEPGDLEAVRSLVQRTTSDCSELRPVATGLSFSDILQTDKTLVDVTRLTAAGHASGILPNQQALWKEPLGTEPRVRFAAGARIRTLNRQLHSAGLAFANLGGFDAQTVIGATSTSTHGSGLGLPPFADLIRSLVLVTTGGRVLQIEPTEGITDPQKFARHYGSGRELLQNDQDFWASVVSLGCMGVIYSMTMAVTPSYLLAESRRVMPWSRVRELLASGEILQRHRHVEVLVNPHRLRRDHSCLLTVRDIPEPGAMKTALPIWRGPLEALMFSKGGQKALLDLLKKDPKVTPEAVQAAIAGLANTKPHVDDSYKIYNVGAINRAKVISAEYAFPLAGNLYLEGVEALIEVVHGNAKRGLYQPSPLAMRFVKSSKAFMSMMYERPTCTVETPVLMGLPGAAEMILSYEKAAYAYGARPHWGQINECTGDPGWLETAYPAADQWLQVYRRFNSQGVFNNHFTDRLQISVQPPRSAPAVAPAGSDAASTTTAAPDSTVSP